MVEQSQALDLAFDIPVDADLSSLLEEASQLNDRLTAFLAASGGLADDVVFAGGLAFEELATNVVRHAQTTDRPTTVRCRAEVHGSRLVLFVRDNGPEFNPLHAAPPNLDAPLAERPVGGLGIHLVRSYFPDLAYKREGGWNVITLAKESAAV